MKLISTRAHGVLDYVTVVAFALIPCLFGLSGAPAYLSYALAAVHLAMTLLTNFPLGPFKLIPIRLHKIVETIVGPVLIVIPWPLGFSGMPRARNVFIAAGIVILLVGILSDYFEGSGREAGSGG